MPKPYIPDGQKITQFVFSNAPVSIIQGPVGCLDADTEYLTVDGWKRIADYDGEVIAEYDGGKLVWREPEAYIDAPCAEMIHFSNENSLSMMLSEEHRVPFFNKSGEWKVKLAADLERVGAKKRIPTTFRVDDQSGLLTEARLRLKVAINADGCFPKRGSQCVVTLRKQRKKDRLVQLLKNAGVPFSRHQHSTRPTEETFAFQRGSFLKRFRGLWHLYSQSQLEIILDEIDHWDGLHDHAEKRYSTTNKEDADFIQFAAHACGRRASISAYSDPRSDDWSTVYTVQITRKGSQKSSVYIRGDHTKVQRVPSPDGRKYCFTTQSGYFLARRDGRIFVTGNSGTSSALIGRCWRHAIEQPPDREGIRATKWVFIRPSYPSLKDTLIKTYKFWMEPGKGSPEMIETPPFRHHITKDTPAARLPDGTRLDFEAIFLAVEPDGDESYYEMLDSWEATGFVINEAQQYRSKTAIDAIMGRAEQGRFPPRLTGGPKWFGMLMDLNAPPEGHWLPYMRGDVDMPEEWTQEKRDEYTKPDDWEFIVQPAGLREVFDTNGKVVGYEDNPLAENNRWRSKPYSKLIQGKSKSWINTKVMNRVGLIRTGDPVFEMFSLERHTSSDIEPQEGFPLIIGLDGARNPFATIWQNIRGSWRCYSELGMRGVSAATFGPALKNHIFTKYPNFCFERDDGVIMGINVWCDPSAIRKGDGSDDSFYSVMRSLGFMVNVAPGNNLWEIRRGAMESAMLRITPDGEMGMLIHSVNAPTLKNALFTGYVLGDDNAPNKSKSGVYADAADSAQYALLGGGEGDAVVGRGPKKKTPKKPPPRKRYKSRRLRG